MFFGFQSVEIEKETKIATLITVLYVARSAYILLRTANEAYAAFY